MLLPKSRWGRFRALLLMNLTRYVSCLSCLGDKASKLKKYSEPLVINKRYYI